MFGLYNERTNELLSNTTVNEVISLSVEMTRLLNVIRKLRKCVLVPLVRTERRKRNQSNPLDDYD